MMEKEEKGREMREEVQRTGGKDCKEREGRGEEELEERG